MDSRAALACVPVIDRYLDDWTRSLGGPAALTEAIRYALLSGGKRLRPALAWHACVAAGEGTPGEASLAAGAAVELVHAFSLVHDDLPAMDDDDLRRGKPTLHIHAGEAMAILAGDAMLALAMGLLVDRSDTPALGMTLVRELTRATEAMIHGQVYDTLGGLSGRLTPQERVELIHRNKTGALIVAACRMGALCGLAARAPWPDLSSPSLAAVTRYAEAVGLMFQITDDLLDAEGSAEQTGKRTRKDADAGKLTYPSVLGIPGSRSAVERLRGVALGALEGLGPSADGLRQLCGVLAERSR